MWELFWRNLIDLIGSKITPIIVLKNMKKKLNKKMNWKEKGRWEQRGVKLKKKTFIINKAPLKFPNLLIK